MAAAATVRRILSSVAVSSSIGLRRRLPLLVCLVLLFSCIAAVGVTCAVCVTAHPAQTLTQTATSFPTAAPPPVSGWTLLLVLAVAPLVVVPARSGARGRASPALLQRFRF